MKGRLHVLFVRSSCQFLSKSGLRSFLRFSIISFSQALCQLIGNGDTRVFVFVLVNLHRDLRLWLQTGQFKVLCKYNGGRSVWCNSNYLELSIFPAYSSKLEWRRKKASQVKFTFDFLWSWNIFCPQNGNLSHSIPSWCLVDRPIQLLVFWLEL